MVGNDNNNLIKYISSYIRFPLVVSLERLPPKVVKKRCKTLHQRQLSSIRRIQYGTVTLDWLTPTSPHSVSQAIISACTDTIDIYNITEEACFTDSGASEDMFPDYSTFPTYHRLHNSYATLGDTTSITIEGIITAVYILNGMTILIHNSLHIQNLSGPLYSLCKYR